MTKQDRPNKKYKHYALKRRIHVAKKNIQGQRSGRVKQRKPERQREGEKEKGRGGRRRARTCLSPENMKASLGSTDISTSCTRLVRFWMWYFTGRDSRTRPYEGSSTDTQKRPSAQDTPWGTTGILFDFTVQLSIRYAYNESPSMC